MWRAFHFKFDWCPAAEMTWLLLSMSGSRCLTNSLREWPLQTFIGLRAEAIRAMSTNLIDTLPSGVLGMLTKDAVSALEVRHIERIRLTEFYFLGSYSVYLQPSVAGILTEQHIDSLKHDDVTRWPCALATALKPQVQKDRKSTRLNSSHT